MLTPSALDKRKVAEFFFVKSEITQVDLKLRHQLVTTMLMSMLLSNNDPS